MSELHHPAPDHTQFDAICDGLEDWERLPEPTTEPAAQAAWRTAQGADAPPQTEESPLDEQILAGLITPW
jgi:hypothetical protein